MKLHSYAVAQGVGGGSAPGDGELRSYVDSLYASGLKARSIARHITTLRNFYRFLLTEKDIGADPTEFLTLPKQWSSLPKLLNLTDLEKLFAAPDLTKPTGVRDRAMLEFLYATGLRVSEMCSFEASVDIEWT